LGIDGNARISFAFYNTKKEIDFFIDKLNIAIKMLK
jgi:selenocysteine lyase/cysteine desulfurase